MKISVKIMLCGLIILLFGGCGIKKNLFVLLPDPDGRVGPIVVTSPGGQQVLSEANQATGLNKAEEAPSAPEIMEPKKIQELFGAALAAAPEPPVQFLLYFQSGTDELTPESVTLIDAVIAAIKSRRSTDISVVGHTDTVGSKEFNRKLSFERARKVAQMLLDRGVEGAIMQVTSHGEENPLVATPDETPEPKNRRVQVTVR